MDEFGVLVQGIGFKSQRNSTPLAELKPKPKSQSTNSNTQSFDSSSSLPVDELDRIFRSNAQPCKPPPPQNFFGGDDIFGGHASSSHQYGTVDLESVFSSSNSNNLNRGNSAGFNDVDDLFGSFVGNSNQKQEESTRNLDDLIPGFGEPIPSKTKVKSETIVRLRPPNSSSTVADDPFLVFESSASKTPHATWPHTMPSDHSTTSKPKTQSSFDEFDDFIMGTNTSGSTVSGTDYVDEIFGGSNSSQQKNAPRPSPMSEDSIFGDFLSADKKPKVNPNSTSTFTMKKTTFSATSVGGEFTSLFGEVTTSSGVFQEIEGESEDRRRARLNRHIRTNARMAEALAEKNQRDLESQYEQEEKRRLAQKLDDNIRCWSTGKEDNLRALLLSLQEVLWPECGWRPVPLTDMITSESVKKVYKKAALCVHPDKVQQKGASIEQKYVAEKVFDLLKEAWNKFCTEELR